METIAFISPRKDLRACQTSTVYKFILCFPSFCFLPSISYTQGQRVKQNERMFGCCCRIDWCHLHNSGSGTRFGFSQPSCSRDLTSAVLLTLLVSVLQVSDKYMQTGELQYFFLSGQKICIKLSLGLMVAPCYYIVTFHCRSLRYETHVML